MLTNAGAVTVTAPQVNDKRTDPATGEPRRGDGRLRIELDGRDPVELAPSVAFSVPRGMLHRPVAPEPTRALKIETTGVAVTGD